MEAKIKIRPKCNQGIGQNSTLAAKKGHWPKISIHAIISMLFLKA
jgi:hypothetical protein